MIRPQLYLKFSSFQSCKAHLILSINVSLKDNHPQLKDLAQIMQTKLKPNLASSVVCQFVSLVTVYILHNFTKWLNPWEIKTIIQVYFSTEKYPITRNIFSKKCTSMAKFTDTFFFLSRRLQILMIILSSNNS